MENSSSLIHLNFYTGVSEHKVRKQTKNFTMLSLSRATNKVALEILKENPLTTSSEISPKIERNSSGGSDLDDTMTTDDGKSDLFRM